MNLIQQIRTLDCSILAAIMVFGAEGAQAQTPLNDNLANGTVLAGTNTTATGTTVGATAEPGEPAHAGYPATHSIWYLWTAPADGSTLVDLSGSVNGTHVAVYVGKYLASLTLVSSNAFGNPDGTGRCVFGVSAGVLYDIAVDVTNSPGPVALKLQFTPTYFPPLITQQPLDQAVVQGGSAIFQVTATSDAPMSYQWIFNATNNITGATNSTLVLANVSLGQMGTYAVVVSNAGGSVTSSNAVLTVNPRPANDDFANRTVLSGSTISTSGSNRFATAEPGEPNPAGWSSPQSVWWTWTAPATGLAFVDVTNSVGNQVLVVYTGNSLTQLVAVASSAWFSPPLAVQFEVSSGTSYQVTVAGVGGASGSFQLDLSFIATNFPPTITQQPTNETVSQGGTAIFQVVATSGLPLSYRWQFNGTTIPGATDASLVLTNVTANQAGSYQAIVSNAGGSATATATLTVNVPPSNDNFVNRSVLSGLVATTTGNNQFATSEPGEPNHAGYPPGASVWWTWTPTSIGEGFINVTGFSVEETLAVYIGSALNQLAAVATNAWINGQVLVHFAVTNAGVPYQIAIADPTGTGGSFQMNVQLALSNFPPTVVQQPPSQTNVIPGQITTFQFTVQSDWPITNQWFFDGVPIGGGTITGGGGGGGGGSGGGGGGGNFTGSFELDNITTNEAGIYQVISTSYGGSVTSAPIVLVVNFPPSNDNFTNRILLSGVNLTALGTTLYATLEPGEPSYLGLLAGGSVWWSWTAPAVGTASITVTGTNAASQILTIFTGGSLTSLMTAASTGPGRTPVLTSFVTTPGTTYQIAVAGGDASFQLNLQFLSANVPPQITQQPVDESVPAGGSTLFQVGAIGGGVLTFQWQFNGANLDGATNATLTLNNISTNQAGAYRAVVSDLGGSVTSSNAQLTVTLLPPNDNFANRIPLTGTNVTTTGSNQYATSEVGEPSHAGWGAGKSVWWTWTAPADGRLQVSVTKYTGNQVLAIYTGGSLLGLFSVTNAIWFQGPLVTQFNVTSGTTYQIAVAGESGAGGSFELGLAFTFIIFPPQIIQQPFNRIVIEGQSTNFQVAATGAAPLTYQWQLFATNLPNATNSTLLLNNVTTNQSGPYQVIVTNPGGSATSIVATLTVKARPPNDDFANRIPLSGNSVTTNGSNLYATSEPNEPAHAGYGPYQSVWWSYTPPLFGIITVDLAGSFYGAVVAVYTGTNLSQLSMVATNAFGNPDGTAKASFVGQAGTAYQIAVQGYSSLTWGNIHLAVTGDFPPVITTQPQDEAVAPGEDVTFGVAAQSQSPLSYQWLFNGLEIPGATSQVLSLSHVSTNQAGNYSVRVNNDVGSVTSSDAILSLTTVLTGEITDATTGDPLGGVLVWAGSVTNVSDTNGNYRLVGVQGFSLETDFDSSVRAGAAPLSVQFFDQSAYNSAILHAETNGYYSYTNDQVQISPNEGVTNSFSISPILPTGTMRLVLNWGAQPRDLDANLQTPVIQGQAYHIYYQTGSRGSLTNLPFAGLNHDSTNGFGPETITIDQFFTGTYTYYVHKYAGLGNIDGSGAIVKIYTETGLGQTVLAPTTGDGDFWMVCTIDGATHALTINNEILTTAPTNQALVLVNGSNPDAPAKLGRHPLDLTPGTATFHWDFGDGNTSTVEDPVHVYTNVGLYSVSLTVTTSNNVVQSEIKTNFIQVFSSPTQPPSIISQPTNQTVVRGSVASFDVAANGSGPLSYQWFFNRTNPLTGATTALLNLANAQPANAGGYSVVVTNSAGAVTSVVATLTVLVPPTIATQPTNETVIVGTTAGFQVVASGSGPLSYQWFFNQTNPIAGATTGLLTLVNSQPALKGGYSVVVANPAGSVTSSVAQLTVLVPPTILITQPANGATFLAGTNITIIATINDPGNIPKQVQFFQAGTNRLGTVANAPYSIVWSNVPAGSYTLTAAVTDNVGLSSTSAAPVFITVTNSAAPSPLAVSITSPPTNSTFCNRNGLVITAQVTGNEPVASVQFFAGNTPLGSVSGQAGQTSYSFTWSPSSVVPLTVGNYLLSAVAADIQARYATSGPPVAVSVVAQCPQVAIVRAAADPEIDQLSNYLSFNLNLSSQVFDQNGLSANLLQGFELIIWDDVGQPASALATNTVDALSTAYSNGIPLYLIGEHLASAATFLPPAQHALWTNLTCLSAPASTGGCASVQTTNVEGLYNPILAASFGSVSNFDYPPGLDWATNANPDAEVFGVSCGADVLIAYPGPDLGATNFTGAYRFVQNVRVLPPGTPQSHANLAILFENISCWLTHCSVCQAPLFALSYDNPPSAAQVGHSFTLTLKTYNNWECPITGVVITNVLPPGVLYLSSSTTLGSSSYEPAANQVVFYFSPFPRFALVEMQITMVPEQVGGITNAAYGRQNAYPPVAPSVNQTIAMVFPSTNTPPVLSMQPIQPGQVQLKLSGQTGINYQVWSSIDLLNWLPLTNVQGPAWAAPLTDLSPTNSPRFYLSTGQ